MRKTKLLLISSPGIGNYGTRTYKGFVPETVEDIKANRWFGLPFKIEEATFVALTGYKVPPYPDRTREYIQYQVFVSRPHVVKREIINQCPHCNGSLKT